MPHTFEQFQATRTPCNDLGTALDDCQWRDNGTVGRGNLYLGSLYIEEVGLADGRWSLPIGNVERVSDDLESLERCLYEFACDEGHTSAPPPSPDALARKFAARLCADLGDATIKEVRLRNRAEASPGVCHSHDFCDANEVMLAACEALGWHPDVGDQADADVWNAAWDLAKASEFTALTSEDRVTLAREFPDFKPETIPADIPDWLQPLFWHNDACPIWGDAALAEGGENGLCLAIDYADPARREHPDAPRFSVWRARNGENAEVLNTDVWAEALAWLAERAPAPAEPVGFV